MKKNVNENHKPIYAEASGNTFLIFDYLDINFAKMIKTCCHELAHYLQFVKYGRSSCKSDLKLSNGKYNPLLAKEHKKFTKKLYGLITNSPEYPQWEKRWKEI